MTENKVIDAKEQEYECMSVLSDFAVLVNNFYTKTYGFSPSLNDAVIFLGRYSDSLSTSLLSDF